MMLWAITLLVLGAIGGNATLIGGGVLLLLASTYLFEGRKQNEKAEAKGDVRGAKQA